VQEIREDGEHSAQRSHRAHQQAGPDQKAHGVLAPILESVLEFEAGLLAR
jgi:hypothetical protein